MNKPQVNQLGVSNLSGRSMTIKSHVIQGINLGYDFDIETNLTDTEATEGLGVIGTTFAQSLYEQSLDRGLSEKQLFWAHVLVLEAQGIKVR
jgi:hypothetical protein